MGSGIYNLVLAISPTGEGRPKLHCFSTLADALGRLLLQTGWTTRGISLCPFAHEYIVMIHDDCSGLQRQTTQSEKSPALKLSRRTSGMDFTINERCLKLGISMYLYIYIDDSRCTLGRIPTH